MRTRDIRRKNAFKKKAKVKKYFRFSTRHFIPTERMIGRTAEHPQSCSGPCCGNQRPYEGPSISEIRHSQDDWNDD